MTVLVENTNVCVDKILYYYAHDVLKYMFCKLLDKMNKYKCYMPVICLTEYSVTLQSMFSTHTVRLVQKCKFV